MIGKLKRKVFPSFVVAALGLNLFVPSIMQAQEVNQTASFKDTNKHWAANQINGWVEKGFIKGYEDNTFKPNNQITRAEFMTIVNKSFGYSQEAAIDYSDVPANAWYRSEIQKAKAAGYISGYEDHTVRPSAPISRQEVAVIIAKIKELDTTSNKDYILNSFKDKASIPTWSKNSVGAIVEKGYMKGYTDGTYQPQKSITRAEAVVTLDNVVEGKAQPVKETIIDKAGTYGSATQGETISGNLVVKAPGVTLVNKVITGDLVLAEGVAEGNVTLDKVTVKGKTIVLGGGENSIHLKSSVLDTVTVNKKNGKVRVVTYGSTSVKETFLQSGATLEENEGTGTGFQNVQIASAIAKDSQVNLTGTYDQVTVDGKDIEINVQEGTTIETLTVKAAVKVTGKGTIELADIQASGSNFEYAPKTHKLGSNITAIFSGKTVRGTSGGGGGGGGTGGSGGGPGSGGGETSDINKAGTTVANYTISTSGTHGPSSGKSTVTGTLTLDPGPNGDISLQNVDAANIVVKSGASNSIHLNGVAVSGQLTIDAGNQQNPVHIVLEGTSTVAQTTAKSQVSLQAAPGSTGQFGNIAIDAKSGTVQLSGDIKSQVTISPNASGITFTIAEGASVTSLDIQAPVIVQINGSVSTTVTVVAGTTVTLGQNATVPDISSTDEDTDNVLKDSASLKIGFINGDTDQSVTQSITLPTTGQKGSTITWVSSNTDIIGVDGVLERALYNEYVTLTATVTSGQIKARKTFTLKVKGKDPVISNITFNGGTVTLEEETNTISVEFTSLTKNFSQASIGVNKDSSLVFNLNGYGTIGPVALQEGPNELKNMTANFGQVKFDPNKPLPDASNLFNALKESGIGKQTFLKFVQVAPIFEGLKDLNPTVKGEVIDSIKFSTLVGSLSALDKEALLNSIDKTELALALIKVEPTYLIQLWNDYDAAKKSGYATKEMIALFNDLESTPGIDRGKLFDAINFTQAIDAVTNSNVNLNQLYEAIPLDQIFATIQKSDSKFYKDILNNIDFHGILNVIKGNDGVKLAVLDLLKALDGKQGDGAFTFSATLEAEGTTTEYTIKIKR